MLATFLRQLGDFLLSPQVFAVAVAAAWQLQVRKQDTRLSASLLYNICTGIFVFILGRVFPHISHSFQIQTLWGTSFHGARYDIPGVITLVLLSSASLKPKDFLICFAELGWIRAAAALLLTHFLGDGFIGDSPYANHYKDVAFAGALISLVVALAFASWIGATVKRLKKPLAFALSCLFTAALGAGGFYLFRANSFTAVLWLIFCVIGFPLILGFLVSSRTTQLTTTQLIDMYKTGVGALPTVLTSIAVIFGSHPKPRTTSIGAPRTRRRKHRPGTEIPTPQPELKPPTPPADVENEKSLHSLEN